MDHPKHPKFEIGSIIEQKPFENPAVQSFFAKWCEINDSIQPQILNRDKWEEKSAKGILEKGTADKQILYIPQDLQLWEMIGVMETVDRDTFAANSERRNKAKRKLLTLGGTFQDVGTYIAQRLDSVKRGKNIARALAEEFYNYGQSLVSGKWPENFESIDKIASHILTTPEVDQIDRFLAGDDLYRSRRARAEKMATADPAKRDELYEAERQKTLNQFFRVAKRALELENKTDNRDLSSGKTHLKPWQSDTPIHSAFLAKIEKELTQHIEAPKRELMNAFFRRGMELLRKNMPFDVPTLKDNYLHWRDRGTKLRDELQIDKLKEELAAIRQSGDLAKIGAKEREITDKIQTAISSFPYKSLANNPSEMVANQFINCVGASILGGALMQEVGLNYLVGDLPEHSVLFLVTTDNQVEWRDMLNVRYKRKVTNEMIDGRKKDGSSLTAADIIAFSKNPAPAGLVFNLVENKRIHYLAVFEPEYGQQIQVLINTGNTLLRLGRDEEAIETYHQAAALEPRCSELYSNLGIVLSKLDRYQEAIEAYRRAIAINPNKSAIPYSNLGGVLYKLGHYEEAAKTYRQSIALNPNEASTYNNLGNALVGLGRYEEASNTYRQAIALNHKYIIPYYNLGRIFAITNRKEEAIKTYQDLINLADPQVDAFLIGRAKEEIARLQK